MNKFLKLIFSRYFLAGICILTEFIWIIAGYMILYEYVLPVTVIQTLLYVLIMINIIGRDDTQEFKVSWLILFFLFPIVSAIIYLVFLPNKKLSKLAKKFDEENLLLSKYLRKDEKIGEEYGYLLNKANLVAYKVDSVKYFSSGVDYYKELLKRLSVAKRFIFLEYFIIKDGVMWGGIFEILRKKAENGVRIFVLYDDVGSIKFNFDKCEKTQKADGIKYCSSNEFRPVFSRVYNNRDHRKICVIDGEIAFTGGVNLADEYIGEEIRFGRWKDGGISFTGEAVKTFTASFISVWNMQNHEKIPHEIYLNTQYKESSNDGIIIPFHTGPRPFYSEQTAKGIYLSIIEKAKNYVYITTPYFVCDYEVINLLKRLAESGVDVKIILPEIPDKKLVKIVGKSYYKTLIDSNVKVMEYVGGFIHSKNVCVDGESVIIGSINFDYRSFYHNFECGVVVTEKSLIKEVEKDFTKTEKECLIINKKTAKRNIFERVFSSILKIFSPLM